MPDRSGPSGGLARARQRWRQSDTTLRDLPLALVLAASATVQSNHGSQIGGVPDRPFDAFTVLVVLVECLPLAVRRRRPADCLALVSLGFAADQLLGYHSVATNALPVALFSAGAHLERHRRLVVLVASAAYVLMAVALNQRGPGEGLTGYVEFFVAEAVAWAVGTWLRQTRRAEAERRRHLEETTRTGERTRIARELHDVVTHHVTAMVVQAEAARYLTAAPERLDATLDAVSGTGRRAIADLRQMLDLLDPEHSVEPVTSTAGELGALVEQTRRAGQPVTFTEEGAPPQVGGSAEAVAYRVVREALTNVLKHDHGASATVQVRHRTGQIHVQVSSDGSGSDASSPGGSGRGLAGLRERVDVLGGDFHAGPSPDGGFLVEASIPTGGPA